jgi:hypothetical protein
MNEIEHPKKRAMLQALEKTLGVVTNAAKMIPISPVTHYNWLKDDAEYAQAVEMIAETCLDFAESKLFELVNSGDTTATIFLLKTKGKKRGYVEKQLIDHTTNGEAITEIKVNIVNDK